MLFSSYKSKYNFMLAIFFQVAYLNKKNPINIPNVFKNTSSTSATPRPVKYCVDSIVLIAKKKNKVIGTKRLNFLMIIPNHPKD